MSDLSERLKTVNKRAALMFGLSAIGAVLAIILLLIWCFTLNKSSLEGAELEGLFHSFWSIALLLIHFLCPPAYILITNRVSYSKKCNKKVENEDAEEEEPLEKAIHFKELLPGSDYIKRHTLISSRLQKAIQAWHISFSALVVLEAFSAWHLGAEGIAGARAFYGAVGFVSIMLAECVCWCIANHWIRSYEKNPVLADVLCDVEKNQRVLRNTIKKNIQDRRAAAIENAQLINAVYLARNTYGEQVSFAEEIMTEAMLPFLKQYFLRKKSGQKNRLEPYCDVLFLKTTGCVCRCMQSDLRCGASHALCPLMSSSKTEFDVCQCPHSSTFIAQEADDFRGLIHEAVHELNLPQTLGHALQNLENSIYKRYPGPVPFLPPAAGPRCGASPPGLDPPAAAPAPSLTTKR